MRRFLTDHTLLIAAQWLAIAVPPLLLGGKLASDIAFSIIAVLFLVHSIVQRDFAWVHVRWVQAAFLLTLYMVVRSAWMADHAGFLCGYSLAWLRLPLGATALAYWVLPDRTTRTRLFYTLAATVCFIIADSYWQFFHGTDLFGYAPATSSDTVIRLTGPFHNPRPGITITWLVFPLLCGWAIPGMRGRAALLALAATGIVFLTGERMALLLLVPGMGLVFLLLPRMRLALVLSGIGAVLFGLIMIHEWPAVGIRQVDATQREVHGFWNSAYGRTWTSAAHVGLAHPLFGVGPKQFQAACIDPAYGPSDALSLHQRCPMHPHNTYLGWFADYGGVGLALYLLLIGCWARDVIAARTWRSEDTVLLGLAVTLVLRLWPVSVTPNQFANWSAIPFWLVVGWLYALLPPKNAPRIDA
jgi:O-antigen ligase